ncbi:MAG: ATP-binding protein [Beijerinckiaceae bacterium]
MTTDSQQHGGAADHIPYERIVALAADAIICVDPDQRILLFNDGARRAFGYEPHEVIGRPLDMLLPERARRGHRGHVAGFAAGPPAARPLGERSSIFALRKNGEEFPADASISKTTTNGSYTLTVVLRDISDRAAAEAELERQVSERTRELQDEIRRREVLHAQLLRVQRMEAYGQLTGGLAHDFNNLLTIIGGNLELLADDLTATRSRRLHKRATEAVAMGARLTERLLTFARRRQLEPKILDINEQVGHLLDLLRRTLGESIRVSSSLAPDLGQVLADRSEVENAILNLAINARDAMPDGGRLVIETDNVMIDDTFMASRQDEPLKPGPYVRISVSDNGSGMTQDVVKSAFEPFFTTKEHGRGTGLGLSTIYGFARQSNGAVTIYSEVGKGTTVNILLPRIDQTEAGEGQRPSAEPPRGRNQLVLAVEDNPDVREVTVTRLRKLGYEVIECVSGVEALDILKARSGFDLVFSDIMMSGGVSGYDVARWVAENRPGLKCLLTTGFAEEIAGAELDAPRILRKPYNLDQLAKALAEILAS